VPADPALRGRALLELAAFDGVESLSG
jgi:hypothetical protein